MKSIIYSLVLANMPLLLLAADNNEVPTPSLFTSVFFWVVMMVLATGIITIFRIINPLVTLRELNALQNKDQAAFENLKNNHDVRLVSNYTLATLGSLITIGVVGWSFYQSTLPSKPTIAESTEAQPAEPTLDATNVVALTDDAALAIGKNIFMSNCTPCHGQAGEGIVGTNLTDNAWIHGGDIKDIFNTISQGVPEKGMVAWSNTLKPDAIQKVASYILSLQGTNPPNAKAPEGQQIGMKE